MMIIYLVLEGRNEQGEKESSINKEGERECMLKNGFLILMGAIPIQF